MTGEKCGEEDMLCQMMKKMSMMNSTGMPPASDPPTCNKDLAGFCMTSYVSRILVSPFAPIDDHEYTCRCVFLSGVYVNIILQPRECSIKKYDLDKVYYRAMFFSKTLEVGTI